MSALRVIPSDKLAVDPDIQLAFTLDERHVSRIAANWRESALGVLQVTSDGNGGFFVIDGRHRLLAGSRVGWPEFRCDVHGHMTAAEKAALKMDTDRHRRRVGPLEHFLVSVIAGDAKDCEILEICRQNGYEIRKLKAGKPYNAIEAVITLSRVYDYVGPGGLDRTLKLASNWISDPGANTGMWIGALALLIRDGYDEEWSPSQEERLKSVVPSIVVRQARGEIGNLGSNSNGEHGSKIEWVIARRLRKAARMRVRPVGLRVGDRDGQQRSGTARELA